MNGTGVEALSATGIDKSYGPVEALRDASIEVETGEVVGLLGINGAGKTTLLSIVAGLLEPDAGTVRLRSGLRVGLAAQDLAVWPPVTVEDNLRFVAESSGLRRKEVRSAIDQALEAVALTPLRRRIVHGLSGGEKRRLHVALSLIGRGDVLLLDEPTANCDPVSRGQLLDVVRSLAAEGRAVVYSTHYLPEVEQLCSRVVVLHEGRVVAAGSVGALIAEYGESAVDLRFAEPPGERLDLDPSCRMLTPTTLRVPCSDPVERAGELLQRLRFEPTPIAAIDLVRPTLEQVFLSLIGASAERTGTALDVR
jgi:ABC-2 type transport system ATP-binding protein